MASFRDMRDGCEYKTVRIGEQTWLAENLRFDCAGSKVYRNDKDYLDRYGRLYDWRTAMNSAPDGWRLPSRNDWDVLTNHVGGKETEGMALKSEYGWICHDRGYDGNGTDEFGFCALPGGCGLANGSFDNARYYCRLWIADEHGSRRAYCREILHNGEDAFWNRCDKSCLFSVRLLRND